MTRLWPTLRRLRGRFAWGMAMLLFTNVTAMAVPQLFAFAVDAIRDGAPPAALRQLALTLTLLAAAGMVFRTLSRVHLLFAARDVEMDLRREYFRHLTALPPSFFAEHPTGDLMSRAVGDLTQIRLMFGPGLLNIVNTAVAYATAVPLMVALSPRLTLLGLAVYPPAVLALRASGKRLYSRSRRQQEALGALSSQVEENLAGVQLVRAYGLEAAQERAFGGRNDALLTANVRLIWTRGIMFRIAGSVASLGTLAIVFVGAGEVMAGRLSLGDIVALVEYMALLAGPTFALGWVLSLWQRGAASLARLEEIFAAVPAEPVPPTAPPAPADTGLTVRNLSLRRGEALALDDVSLAVSPGSTLGIVGPIGAGKSTLLACFLRLLPVPPDTVFLGGADIAAMGLAALRAQFGYVPQEALLLSKTLADNVAFGRPDAAPDAIAAAIRDAALDGDVATLPAGTATAIGERGVALSGGQKQRLALARALLCEPPVLLLDDALAAVDAATEQRILARLSTLRRGRTTVIVAHRVSAVKDAHHIVVLDAGRVVAQGTHAALAAGGGVYAAMLRRQGEPT